MHRHILFSLSFKSSVRVTLSPLTHTACSFLRCLGHTTPFADELFTRSPCHQSPVIVGSNSEAGGTAPSLPSYSLPSGGCLCVCLSIPPAPCHVWLHSCMCALAGTAGRRLELSDGAYSKEEHPHVHSTASQAQFVPAHTRTVPTLAQSVQQHRGLPQAQTVSTGAQKSSLAARPRTLQSVTAALGTSGGIGVSSTGVSIVSDPNSTVVIVAGQPLTQAVLESGVLDSSAGLNAPSVASGAFAPFVPTNASDAGSNPDAFEASPGVTNAVFHPSLATLPLYNNEVRALTVCARGNVLSNSCLCTSVAIAYECIRILACPCLPSLPVSR